MRRLIVLILLVFVGFTLSLFPVREDDNFSKGLAYLLIKDAAQAEKFFNVFFKKNLNPNIISGFQLLVKGDNEGATRQFKNFLDMNHRSTIALVGIALSTSTMEVSNSSEILKRAIRLDRGYAPAYLCLGVEYLKEKNYPMAEQSFRRALSLSGIAEFKILLGRLYLTLGKPDAALGLLKPEADQTPDNFYYNLLTAQAYLQMNRLNELGRYIEAAMELNPNSNEAAVLTAKYHLNQNNPQKARLILSGLNYETYNEDYMRTYAKALVRLKDKKAGNYLYEVFSRKKWDTDINLLMGQFHLWLGGEGNVQNWIYRSILCGTSVERLKEIFPDKYKFPEYKSLPFFDVKAIHWLSKDTLLVIAVRNSGEPERVYIIDMERMKITQTMAFSGKLQEMFVSGDGNSIIISSTARENESVYLYAVSMAGRNLRLRPLFNRPINMVSVAVGFNKAGTIAYITDKRVDTVPFEAPFSLVSQYGEKTPVYPKYPFPIYKYYFANGRMTMLKNLEKAETVPPVKGLIKYALVADGMYGNGQVLALIEKGKQLDLTSSEQVRVVFSQDLRSFIIYLSDVSNAFKGYVWDNDTNTAMPIDEIMFLGKGNYAEIILVDLDAKRNEILVMTKKQQELIQYNYKSHLYLRLAKDVSSVRYNRRNRMVYAVNANGLNERRSRNSDLRVISLEPYLNNRVGTHLVVTDIVDCSDETEVYFTTYNGEIVKMDSEYQFTYVKPSWEGSHYEESPFDKRTAVFVNGHLWLVEF